MCNDKNLEGYKLIRSRIEFEYSQIGNRLNWLITSQSFLFVALVINLSSIVNLQTPANKDCKFDSVPENGLWNNVFQAVDIINDYSLFYPILPGLGLLLSIITIISGLAAMFRIIELKNIEKNVIESLRRANYQFSFVSENRVAHYLGLFPIVFIPVSFSLIWFFILNPNLFDNDFFIVKVEIDVLMVIINLIISISFGIIFSYYVLENDKDKISIYCVYFIFIIIFGFCLYHTKTSYFWLFASFNVSFFLFSVLAITSGLMKSLRETSSTAPVSVPPPVPPPSPASPPSRPA